MWWGICRGGWESRAAIRSRAASIRRCTAAACGRCGSFPASAARPTPTGATTSSSSAVDMEDLFRGIPLDQVSTSMTINGPAAILFCFYVVAGERQGVEVGKLRGTVQNDILKEYMAQHAWVYPVEPALKVIVDMFEWCRR